MTLYKPLCTPNGPNRQSSSLCCHLVTANQDRGQTVYQRQVNYMYMDTTPAVVTYILICSVNISFTGISELGVAALLLKNSWLLFWNGAASLTVAACQHATVHCMHAPLVSVCRRARKSSCTCTWLTLGSYRQPANRYVCCNLPFHSRLLQHLYNWWR